MRGIRFVVRCRDSWFGAGRQGRVGSLAGNGCSGILVAGAINTDLVATIERAPVAGETLNGTGFSIHGGGKAANQAVAAARSGATVSLIGAVGDDDFGRARLNDLVRDGVETTCVHVSRDLPSGVALIFVETGGENRIVCVPGATESVTVEQARSAFQEATPCWLLATNELPHPVLRELFALARANGTQIVFNAAPELSGSADFLESVDVLIVNQIEAGALLGRAGITDPVAVASQLHERGIRTVVLTLGEAGAVLSDGDQVIQVTPPPVTAVDTTGAGDTFAGALVAELSLGSSMHDALVYAVHASALSVTTPGAQTAIPTREGVQARWPDLVRVT